MFGSLVNTKRNKMLTYVENADLESALSRTKRPKVHISCEVCRTRKIKCSGNSSGCTRCVAMGVQCKYPPRESRKRKSASSIKTTQAVQKADERGWQLNIPQAGTSCSPDSHDNNRKSWASGEISIAQSDGSNDLTMTEDMFIDVDNDQLQEKPLSLSWEDPSDSVWWSSEIDFAASQSPSLLFDGQYDAGQIQTDNLHQVLGLLPPIETNFINQDSMSRQSSTRSQPTQISDHGYHSRSSASASTSPSDASWSGLSGDSWITSQLRHSELNNRGSNEQLQVHSGDYSFGNGISRCGCLHRAALFLVELGQINARMEHGPLDILLGHFREGLATFGTLIECEHCNSIDESSTLNVVAARCLGVLCENVVKSYIGSLTPVSDYGSRSRTADEIWYSSYSIHNNHEREAVLRCIVMVQVSQLRNWLEKLKTRTSNSKKHASLMFEVEEKVKAVSSMLSQHGKQEFLVE